MNNSMPFILNVFSLATTFFCSWYIFVKALKIHMNSKHLVYIISLNIILPSLSMIAREKGVLLNEICLILATIISLIILYRKNTLTAFITSIISIGIAYIIDCISIILITTIIYFINYKFVNLLTIAATNLLEIIVTISFMKIKRFKNGFSFIQNKENLGIGIFISGLSIVIMGLLTQNELIPNSIIPFLIIGIALSFIGIYLWIKKVFAIHYRKRLKLRAEEYSKLELAEKSKEIEKLSDENTSLSSIIHLDNHIIQSIESELKALNSTELTDKLLTSINQRNEYVNDLLIKSKNLASTGNAGVDAVLLDLYIKAASRGIDFNLNTDCDINYLINNIITKNDFEALLRELITNSIIAVENNPKITGRISINISQPNDIYELTVMDNGSFIDNNSIPDTIEKSKASITTNHFENNDSFTKSVTIRFDGLNMNERIF